MNENETLRKIGFKNKILTRQEIICFLGQHEKKSRAVNFGDNFF